MFGWFRKKQVPVEQTEAFQLGRRAGDSMANDLDAFMQARFEPAYNSLLGVLNDRFTDAMGGGDAPPIILGRIEYKIFLENIDEFRPQMRAEVDAAMARWLEVSEQLNMRTDFERLIQDRVDGLVNRLTMDGLQKFIDRADQFKEADDYWRAENPEKSAQFPPDQ